MPKIKSDYPQTIQFRVSDNMLTLIKNARLSKSARRQFGNVPNQTQFIRAAIFEWVQNYAPEMTKNQNEIAEIIEYNTYTND